MQHLIDMNDLSVAEIQALIETAQDIIAAPEKYRQKCVGRILATLFFEPSTRTRLSFESAMQSLGGSTLGFASADTSSATKGETVADTIRVVSAYADICAMRHPKEGSALVASQFATIPVINGGDGGNQHPTQTLTDLLTIHNKKGRLNNLCIGICGDLKFGRTVHSLVKSLTKYTGNRYILVSPEELKVPGYIREDVLKAGGHDYVETQDLESNIADMDILYMTRVQRERFFNEEDYIRLKDRYILDREKLNSAKADLSVMHPLPRVNEIAGEIDQDPRAHYFDQVRYGRYIRMALIMKLLEVA